jgi:hypothetical protein
MGKALIIILLSFLFGFGFWYIIFWFVSNQPNLFLWHWVTKLFYLFLSYAATQGIAEGIFKEKNL